MRPRKKKGKLHTDASEELPSIAPTTNIRQTSVSRRFWLDRKEDVSGISGTGIVAEGIIFTSGSCVLTWLTGIAQISVYPSLDHVRMIHGHDGMTEIVWENDTLPPSTVLTDG